MAGYDGYSKSNNAVDAEDEGRYPVTKAARIVAKATRVTIREARRVLTELGTTEFHHSSKFYNTVKYYNTKRAIDMILHDDPDYTEDLESEKLDQEVLADGEKQKICNHEFIEVSRDRKKSEGGGKILSHHRCKKCGYIPEIGY